MPIDTYKLYTSQDDQEADINQAATSGHAPRPSFELDQRQINVAPRGLTERDFTQAVMNPEDRRAAEEAWDLQEEQQQLDLEMFDNMNNEQAAARSQVAEVRRESADLVPGVTEEMVRGWSYETQIHRNGEISKAIAARRRQVLNA